MKVAVVGVGVAGLTAAHTLASAGIQVTLYEKEDYVGGHARTIHDVGIGLDTGFMVFNRVTYPNMIDFFEQAGVEMEESDMSFSVSLNGGKGCEWGSTSLGGLFAQKRNMINPFFFQMIREIVRFKDDVLSYLEKIESGDESIRQDETLGEFLASHKYSNKFRECYLVPVCGSIWSCSSDVVLGFSAASILTFCKNHHLLQLFQRPQWLTVKGRSETYVAKMVAGLEAAGADIRTSCEVKRISSIAGGVEIEDARGGVEVFDRCLVGSHAPDALQMLGEGATHEERTILGAFQYSPSTIYLHRDDKWMPRNQAAWSAWNFLGDSSGQVCVSYWLNILQNLGNTGKPYLVTLNPTEEPRHIVNVWRTSHPIPSPGAAKAAKAFGSIQGKRGIWFCGAYQGYGFHEDGLKSGLEAAFDLLGTQFKPLPLVKQMVPTYLESATRLVVTSFLRKFIRTGHVQLFEAGGTVFNFFGEEKGCTLKTSLRVSDPAFYWKIATRQDLGLADAYIDGDFSFVDPKEGLLNFLLIIIANRDIDRLFSSKSSVNPWWSPVLLTSVLGSATSYFRHMMRNNSLTNTRRNISQHYDLSNDMFSLFLDETMTYSCAIFKGPDEPLVDAQMRKINHLIDKARVESTHEVLEIGCGWGALAIQLVRRSGCRYTGITLSQEQLDYAQALVKEARLEDKITFQLVDYRNVQGFHKFNRIISCEMLEAVGHEYYAEWFRRCDTLLAKDGLVVVQVISIPEERYDGYRQSSDFIKEYIFPGGCLPSFAALTTAMSSGSSFCVEHMENIGIHYCETLLRWQEQFTRNRNKIMKLGFGEKFIRTWDYYFFYCAAGFKSCTLGVLQIVFSRPGNEAFLGCPYVSFPTA
ncbi:uncharacterized protein [Physcomitrium patens]|uniref:Amine oxidase domain-containing protein n=1 Tax=Physcomitrium patens TaxID=3218 RepID=A9SS10_PHYPA|nr:uncharacterized protein LOC112285276 [Physcomitrium patens]XP_024381729.1 uncharacterized protein LOC112285276 [Physcomitrium patens]XP_024381737.1 uncharacterized protein LOC112285276 [Physcomitrium patens]PNR63472.1 hypothetical protein PHYPA_001898 [Physcomitrium patens]|eukprot:XP_024381721.1 uncharacterized protein LOC112285276 [Physcomitrella patens]